MRTCIQMSDGAPGHCNNEVTAKLASLMEYLMSAQMWYNVLYHFMLCWGNAAKQNIVLLVKLFWSRSGSAAGTPHFLIHWPPKSSLVLGSMNLRRLTRLIHRYLFSSHPHYLVCCPPFLGIEMSFLHKKIVSDAWPHSTTLLSLLHCTQLP